MEEQPGIFGASPNRFNDCTASSKRVSLKRKVDAMKGNTVVGEETVY
jgi:hypothetical protein